MKMPLGLAPQRSKALPSLRVLTEEAKLQVPTRRLAMESRRGAGSACAPPGIAAAAMPSSAMNSRLSIAVPRSHVFYNSSISRGGRMHELASLAAAQHFPGAPSAYGPVTVSGPRGLHALG